uniref:Uncharacterized protein n=1 Tax=Strongyloides papillosus TaxID=174720 RepID=A0A0N5BQA9_STREA
MRSEIKSFWSNGLRNLYCSGIKKMKALKKDANSEEYDVMEIVRDGDDKHIITFSKIEINITDQNKEFLV